MFSALKIKTPPSGSATAQRTQEARPEVEGGEQKLHLQTRKQMLLAEVLLSHQSASRRITQEINSPLKKCKLIKQPCFDACSARSISVESITQRCSLTAVTLQRLQKYFHISAVLFIPESEKFVVITFKRCNL